MFSCTKLVVIVYRASAHARHLEKRKSVSRTVRAFESVFLGVLRLSEKHFCVVSFPSVCFQRPSDGLSRSVLETFLLVFPVLWVSLLENLCVCRSIRVGCGERGEMRMGVQFLVSGLMFFWLVERVVVVCSNSWGKSDVQCCVCVGESVVLDWAVQVAG